MKIEPFQNNPVRFLFKSFMFFFFAIFLAACGGDGDGGNDGGASAVTLISIDITPTNPSIASAQANSLPRPEHSAMGQRRI